MDGVLWVEGDEKIKLAIVLKPRGDDWLKDDLRQIKRDGVQTLASMLEPQEAAWLGLKEERLVAEELGMQFLNYPIQDVHVPSNVATFRRFVADLAYRLRKGEQVGLHCRGSIGRAPLTAACTLIHLGWTAKNAIVAIQAARGFPIPDTEEQLRWIMNYAAQP